MQKRYDDTALLLEPPTRLGFEHPGTGEQVSFTSRYPADLDWALETLRDGGPR